MSAEHPKTLAEWKAHTERLEGEALHTEGRAMNTAQFVRSLQDEGYSASEIHAIFILFARRFAALELRPPTDGLYNFFRLAGTELPVEIS